MENDLQNYLSIVTDHLKSNDFKISNNIQYQNQVFDLIAKKTQFLMKRGGFFTTFFMIAKVNNPDITLLNDFSTMAFQYAKKKSGIHPPRGCLYGLRCFPTVIVNSINRDTENYIRNMNIPRHWSASEKLVVFKLDTKTLHHSEQNPYWGSFYHEQDRLLVNLILTP